MSLQTRFVLIFSIIFFLVLALTTTFYFIFTPQNSIFLVSSLLLLGLLVTLSVLYMVKILVIKRISILAEWVNNLNLNSKTSTPMVMLGKDEVTLLAANINNLLTKMENTYHQSQMSEDFTSALLYDSPIPVIVTNPDGSIRYVNPAFEKITGYSELQLVNRKPPFPWWTSSETQQYFEEVNEAAARGAQKLEKRYLKPDGSIFWVEVSISVVKQEGKIKYFVSNWMDITERKQAEVALKESENRFRELAELLPELVFEVDLNGNLVFINRILFSVFGYLKEDARKIKLPDLVAPEDCPRLQHDVQNILSGGIFSNTEYTAQRKDGTRFPVFLHATQIKNEFGEIVGLRGILVDITNLKQIESELRASEEFSSSLLNNAPNPIVVSNKDSTIRYINPAFELLTGFSSVDVIGKGAPYPWWPDNTPDPVLTASQERDSINVEKYYRKKNGEYFWVNVTNNPFIENGEIQYYVGNWVDITARKKTEDALKTSQEFTSSLLDYSPYPIMVINPDTSIRYVNAALEKLSGFTSAELVGQKIPYPFSRANSQSDSYTQFSNMLNPKKFETVLFKKNGESFYVDITSTPILKDTMVNYVLSMWVDITAQKRANEQLEILYQREKAISQELQSEIRSRTEFTRALVHELKTPLTPIMASSELLVEELNTEPLLGLARNVHRGAENMNRRVDEMLDLARGEVGMLKVNINPVDPARLLQEIIRYMEPHARSNGQTLILSIPEKLPVIMADEDRVRQILFNLINNSIKYSPSPGYIRVTAHVKDNELVVQIQDTGRGMSEEEQKRLFQPYYRIEGREHLSGLGLGLTLSKKLVELQNGRIWVVSRKGEGSTFSFTLPIKREDNV